MFDIGFWELALIGVVALLVVGPERLPGLAREVGRWVARIRRYVSAVRDDIEREIRSEELKDLMSKSKSSNPLSDITEETTGAIGALRKQLEGAEKDGADKSRPATPGEAKKDTDKESAAMASAARASAAAQLAAQESVPAQTSAPQDGGEDGAAADAGGAPAAGAAAFRPGDDAAGIEDGRAAPVTSAGEGEGVAREGGDGREKHERRSG